MSKRPISVTIIAWIYILVGVGGIAAHITELNPRHPFELEVVEALVVRLLGIGAGVFMVRGCNWARWLAVAWIAFHVALSAFHARQGLIIHAALFVVFTFFLFRSAANEYFRGVKADQRSIHHGGTA